MNTANANDIAIIGMPCLFPGASNLDCFWRNILDGVCAIADCQDPWEAGRGAAAPDSLQTTAGGFLGELYTFDPAEFGIMPNSVDGQEPDQFIALKVARDALAHAGCLGESYDHARTGIILGHSTYLHRGQGTLVQHGVVIEQTLELLKQLYPQLEEQAAQRIRGILQAKLPPFNADTAPGLAPNMMTGRIANRLNLKGPNYLIDAACASSLLAVYAAMQELRAGRSDLMLAGGVNGATLEEVYRLFNHLGALSRRARLAPFDAQADGTLLGEGVGILVLKRLEDAERDGHTIYAVLKEVGQSSDGRGLGLLAPSLEGESLAIQRAYMQAGIEPSSIGLLEAHGTGIPLGDRTEIEALCQVFGRRKGKLPHCALGSVKSMIGHCIPAAGVAGLIKAALALHYKVLPPTLCAQPNPALELERTPFYVNTEPRPWVHPAHEARRAGVNAFGFGGINTHAILEEYRGRTRGRTSFFILPLGKGEGRGGGDERDTRGGYRDLPIFKDRDEIDRAAVQDWETELVLLCAPEREALLLRLDTVVELIERRRDENIRLADVAYSLSKDLLTPTPSFPLTQEEGGGLSRHAGLQTMERLAIVANGLDDLLQKVRHARERLSDRNRHRLQVRSGIFFADCSLGGGLAFLFPGEGAQYPHMLSDLALHFPVVRQWFDFWEGIYRDTRDFPSSAALFPPPNSLAAADREWLEKQLYGLEIGSESTFIACQALFSLLTELGLRPEAMVGHSSGENSALVASGMVRNGGGVRLREHILKLNQMYQEIESAGEVVRGALLAVGAVPRQQVLDLIQMSDGRLHLALDNCHHQVVLFGAEEAVELAAEELRRRGGLCSHLPFDRAYHTPLFAPVSRAVEALCREVAFQPVAVSVYSCVTADRFPQQEEEIRHLAAVQWSSSVRFTETVERMYADGLRYFVEVGPSGNLSAFVDDILRDREHLAVSANHRSRPGLLQLQHLLGLLFVHGRDFNVEYLFQGRIAAKGLELSVPAQNQVRRPPRLRKVLPAIALEPREVEEIERLLARPPEDIPTGSQKVFPPPAAAEPIWEEGETEHVVLNHLALMQEFLRQHERVLQIGVADLAQEGSSLPFIQHLVLRRPDRVVAEFALSVADQPFLRQHTLYAQTVSESDPDLCSLPVVPLAVSLEMLAEIASLAATRSLLVAFEEVRTYNWIAVEEGRKTVRLVAEPAGTSAEGERIHAALYDQDLLVVEGDVVFAETPARGDSALQELKSPRQPVWADQELYTSGMFHGPLYHSVRHLIAWDNTGIDAELGTTSLEGFLGNGEAPGLFLNPVLMDAVGHLAAFWVAQGHGTDFSCFPSRIERIDLVDPARQDTEGFHLRGRLTFLEEGREARFLTGDYECLDLKGRALFRIHDWRDRFIKVPHSFFYARTHPREGWYGEDWSGLCPNLPQDTLLWFGPAFPAGFLEEAGGVWKRLLACTVLSRGEREAWKALPPNPRRRNEWLMGRIALKEAARAWMARHYGVLPYPADIEVGVRTGGKPYLTSVLPVPLPEVSLAHAQGYTVAVAGPTDRRLGIDLETFGRIRLHDFLTGAFTREELYHVESAPEAQREEVALRLWCAKEAAAKCLGTGLNGRPHLFAVEHLGSEGRFAIVCNQGLQVPVSIWKHERKIVALANREAFLNELH